MTLEGLKYYLTNPKKLYAFLASRKLLNWMSDEAYLKLAFRMNMGKKLDLENPKSYSEKLQWLKLHDRNPLYTELVDKYEVRGHIAAAIGEDALIPLVGGPWERFDDIDFDSLPDQFVLKCTHDSGGLVICREKGALDRKKAKAKIEKSLSRNYYWNNREWPYKNVKPRIIAEKYMAEENGTELKDYKFFCFGGKVKAMFIATDRYAETETCFDFFNEKFEHLPFTNGHPNAARTPAKPEGLEEMIRVAEKLAENLPQARVDLYNINGKIYFGEITFFHWSGMVPYEPEAWDYQFGQWLQLPARRD